MIIEPIGRDLREVCGVQIVRASCGHHGILPEETTAGFCPVAWLPVKVFFLPVL